MNCSFSVAFSKKVKIVFAFDKFRKGICMAYYFYNKRTVKVSRCKKVNKNKMKGENSFVFIKNQCCFLAAFSFLYKREEIKINFL